MNLCLYIAKFIGLKGIAHKSKCLSNDLDIFNINSMKFTFILLYINALERSATIAFLSTIKQQKTKNLIRIMELSQI
jgi:hypothetical protein